jgi:hypothetical protein
VPRGLEIRIGERLAQLRAANAARRDDAAAGLALPGRARG